MYFRCLGHAAMLTALSLTGWTASADNEADRLERAWMIVSGQTQEGQASCLRRNVNATNSSNVTYSVVRANSNGSCPAIETREETQTRCRLFNEHIRDIEFSTGVDTGYEGENLYASLGLDWDFAVQPTFDGQRFIRMDQWRLYTRAGVRGGGNLGIFAVGASAGGGAEATVSFLRPYDSACAAINPMNTVLFTQTPTNARALLRRMQVGDYYRYEGQLNVNANIGISAGEPIGASINGDYLLSGAFQMHIRRLDNKMFNLQFVGDPTSIFGISMNVGVLRGTELTGDSLADRTLIRVLRLNRLIRIGFIENRDTGAILFDFNVDMTNPEAAAAIDTLLGRYFRLDGDTVSRFLRLLPFGNDGYETPYRRAMEVVQSHFVNLEPLQRLAARPVGPQPNPVTLNAHVGDVSNVRSALNWELNMLPFVRWQSTNYANRNYLTDYGSEGPADDAFYIILDDQRTMRRRGIYGRQYFGTDGLDVMFTAEADIGDSSIIASSDPESWTPRQFVNLSYSNTIRSTRIRNSELTRVLRMVQRIVGADYARLIAEATAGGWIIPTRNPGSPSLTEDRQQAGGQIILTYSINGEAYEQMLQRAPGRRDFITMVQRILTQFQRDQLLDRRSDAERLAQNARSLARRLSVVFDPNATSTQRYEEFLKLRRSRFFRVYGTAVLIGVARELGVDPVPLITLKLDLTSSAVELPFNYTFGTAQLDAEITRIRETLNQVLTLDDRRDPIELYNRGAH